MRFSRIRIFYVSQLKKEKTGEGKHLLEKCVPFPCPASTAHTIPSPPKTPTSSNICWRFQGKWKIPEKPLPLSPSRNCIKKVPGIFREPFLCSCERGSRAMAFLGFFIFPETVSRYSMTLASLEGKGWCEPCWQGRGREHISPADVCLLQFSLFSIGRRKKSWCERIASGFL